MKFIQFIQQLGRNSDSAPANANPLWSSKDPAGHCAFGLGSTFRAPRPQKTTCEQKLIFWGFVLKIETYWHIETTFCSGQSHGPSWGLKSPSHQKRMSFVAKLPRTSCNGEVEVETEVSWGFQWKQWLGLRLRTSKTIQFKIEQHNRRKKHDKLNNSR